MVGNPRRNEDTKAGLDEAAGEVSSRHGFPADQRSRCRPEKRRLEKGTRLHRDKRMVCMVVGLFLLTAVPGFVPSARADSSSPFELVRSGSDRGLRIIKSSLFEGGPGLQQRRDEILRIVEEYFDFDEIAKRALGRPWKDLAPEKRQEFVRLFKELLFDTYVSRIEATARPDTGIRYDRQSVEGRYAVVKTWVTNAGRPDFQIDYRLLLSGGQWKVYDVVIEGISLVGNYREQFASILTNESFDALLKRLQEKVRTRSPLQ